MLPDGAARAGFFIGDGAGMGKGREIAGLLAENILQACSPSASRSYALRSYCNAYVRSALLTGL
jgi:hypothetical protein